jgi:hypothetical protein
MTFRFFTDGCGHPQSSSYFLYGSKVCYNRIVTASFTRGIRCPMSDWLTNLIYCSHTPGQGCVSWNGTSSPEVCYD